MSNPTVNPLGAGGDVTKAAERLRAISQRGELVADDHSQPQGTHAAPEANQTDDAQRQRDDKGRFVKQEPDAGESLDDIEAASPDSEDGLQDAEPSEEDGTAESADDQTTDDDTVELATTIDGLAEQLGIESSDLLDHVQVEVTVDGETKEVPLKDIVSGHQMLSDYTRKTTELATQRRELEAERKQATEARESYAREIQTLKQHLMADGIGYTPPEQLQALLNAGDLQSFEEARIRNEKLGLLEQEQQRLMRDHQSDAIKAHNDDVAEQERRLETLAPEWAKNPEEGARELGRIRDYLKSVGVENADDVYNADSLIIARKAMLWDKLQTDKKTKLKPVKNVPKFQKPGAAKPQEDPSRQKIRVSRNRLKRSGRVDDAARLIRDMGIA